MEEPTKQLIENITNLSREEINSIELKMTSKGEYSWNIKLHYKPNDEEKTIQKIVEIDNKLKSIYKR